MLKETLLSALPAGIRDPEALLGEFEALELRGLEVLAARLRAISELFAEFLLRVGSVASEGPFPALHKLRPF